MTLRCDPHIAGSFMRAYVALCRCWAGAGLERLTGEGVECVGDVGGRGAAATGARWLGQMGRAGRTPSARSRRRVRRQGLGLGHCRSCSIPARCRKVSVQSPQQRWRCALHCQRHSNGSFHMGDAREQRFVPGEACSPVLKVNAPRTCERQLKNSSYAGSHGHTRVEGRVGWLLRDG